MERVFIGISQVVFEKHQIFTTDTENEMFLKLQSSLILINRSLHPELGDKVLLPSASPFLNLSKINSLEKPIEQTSFVTYL